MSPIDHLIITVVGPRRAQAHEPRPTPVPAPGEPGHRSPKPPAGPPGRISG